MIPVQNIYYMLAYAFQELKKNNYAHIDKEDFENIFEKQTLVRCSSEVLKSNSILKQKFFNEFKTK